MGRRPKVSDEAIYAAVAARRMGFDSMAWQVPIISLTAQAFLLTLALGPESSVLARIVGAALSSLVSVLSIVLLARHRQADIADGEWLAWVESRRTRSDEAAASLLEASAGSGTQASREDAHIPPSDFLVHSYAWRQRRNSVPIGGPLNLFKQAPTFFIWQGGLVLFLLVGVGSALVALVSPGLLDANAPLMPVPAPTP